MLKMIFLKFFFFLLSAFGGVHQSSPFHSLLSLEDRERFLAKKRNPLLESPAAVKARRMSASNNRLNHGGAGVAGGVGVASHVTLVSPASDKLPNLIDTFDETDESEDADPGLVLKPGAYPAKSSKYWFSNIRNYKYL
jgi:hypothetical protein